MTEPGAPGNGRGRRRSPIAAVVLVLVAAAVLSTATLFAARWLVGPHARTPGNEPSRLGLVRLDRQARPVSLPSLDGSGKVDLSGLAGKPIVMNFWSSHCPPCKRETPALAAVASTLGGKVSFVGIDTVDDRAKAIAFATQYKVSYPLAFDPNGTAADEYGVPGLPVTFFLSASGKTILGENIGALTAPRLRQILHQLYHVG